MLSPDAETPRVTAGDFCFYVRRVNGATKYMRCLSDQACAAGEEEVTQGDIPAQVLQALGPEYDRLRLSGAPRHALGAPESVISRA